VLWTIVFSAIGEDGVEGYDQVLAKGGRVFLQQGLAGHFSRFLSQHGAGNQQLEVASAASLAQRLNALYR